MTRRISFMVAGLTLALTGSLLQAQSPGGAMTASAAAPEVGTVAPDFTAPWADAQGTRAHPVHLADLRGKVVVLAFFPLDRSRGCTAEMHKFRDDYTKIFGANAGKDVVVLPISIDTLAEHAGWVRDDHFPFALVSDPQQAVSGLYGSALPGRHYDARTVFVIGRDGKITYRNLKFGALSEKAYDDLTVAVARAAGGRSGA